MAKAKAKAKPRKPAEPVRCPSCGGRLLWHSGKAQCTVPGCGWAGKP